MEFEQTISKWLNYFRETVELSYDKENVKMMHTAAEGTGTGSWTSWLVQNEFFICLFVCFLKQ